MDFLKTLGAIVLGTLGKKEFDTDKSGHLVLTAEESEKLDVQMKYAGGNFAASFKHAFDTQADGNASGDLAQSEIVIKALVDAIRNDAYTELNANSEQLKKAVQDEFDKQLNGAVKAKTDAETKVKELEAEKARLEKENSVLAAKTEPDTVEATTGKPAVAPVGKFKANRTFFHNKMAFDYINGDSSSAIVAMTNNSFGNRTMGGGPADTIDVSQINEEFGVYLSDPATRLTIFKELLRATESRKYMTKVLAIVEYRNSQSFITSVVQQFIAKWTPLGQAKFTPLRIVNRRHKINLPIVPDDITGGYLTYLYNEGVTPDQMPVTRYVIDELLRPRISDDIEYKMIANGVFEELVPANVAEGDTGQAPEKSMDGFLTILRQEAIKVGTTLNFWTPSVAWSEDNSVEYFEAYAKWVMKTSPVLGKMGLNIFCDPEMEETRQKKYREMFPMTKNNDMGNRKIDFSNMNVVPLENMRGSGIIFSTPKENFIELHHINESSGATKLFLQLMNYEVRVFGEFWLGVGFAVGEWVFAAMPEGSGSGA